MKTRRAVSLKSRIIFILLCLLVPLVLVLNFYAFYINALFVRQIAELNRAQLQGFVGRAAEALNTARSSALEVVTSNYDFRRLARETEALEAYGNAYAAYLSCKSIVAAQPAIAGLVVCSPVNGQYLSAWNGRLTGADNALAKQQVLRHLQDTLPGSAREDLPGGWVALELEGRAFLCQLLFQTPAKPEAFLYCLIDLEYLAAEAEPAVAFAQDGAYLTRRALAEENGLVVPGNGDDYVIRGSPGRYMLLGQDVPSTALRAVALVSYEDLYAGVGPLQAVLLLVSALAVLLVPLGYGWVSRALFRPLDDLVAVMEKAATGDLTVRAGSQYRERELRTMSTTFNGMMEQIRALKIESYERELEVRQAQLDFLQMQIRPHFYLNCMKNLYGMAQAHQYDDIQRMLVLLSDYLRYMMQSKAQWVTLEEELQNSRNYILLQQFNQAYPPECSISVDTAVLRVRIPPITVLTFVENSMKYATNGGKRVIQLRARRLVAEQGPMLHLSIQDNGQGFPAGLLDRLNHLDAAPLPESHVGINNVWMRFKLLYQKDFGMVFSNSGGALVELFLPIGEQNDTVDR